MCFFLAQIAFAHQSHYVTCGFFGLPDHGAELLPAAAAGAASAGAMLTLNAHRPSATLQAACKPAGPGQKLQRKWCYC